MDVFNGPPTTSASEHTAQPLFKSVVSGSMGCWVFVLAGMLAVRPTDAVNTHPIGVWCAAVN